MRSYNSQSPASHTNHKQLPCASDRRFRLAPERCEPKGWGVALMNAFLRKTSNFGAYTN
jgi:hypothetical protein